MRSEAPAIGACEPEHMFAGRLHRRGLWLRTRQQSSNQLLFLPDREMLCSLVRL